MTVTPESTAPLAPHELLNQAMKEPPIDKDGEKQLSVAKEIFIAALRPSLEKNPEQISEGFMKISAVIAVDAAKILLKRLAGNS